MLSCTNDLKINMRFIRNPAIMIPFVDNRDWSKYNQHLILRREFYLSLDFIAD